MLADTIDVEDGMRALTAMFLLGSLAGCVTEKGPEDPSSPPGAGSADCETDDECGSGEICEEEECVEGDRDDAFAGANPILQNDPQDGIIVPEGDIDTYVYTSLGPEWLRIETTTIGDPVDNLDTVVRVFAANGAEHAVMDNFATGRVTTYDTVLYVFLPRADTWYVTVEDVTTYYTDFFTEADWRGDSDFTYTLNLTAFEGTTSEPDSSDDPSTALTLSNGTSIWAVGVNLEAAGDSDWISVELPNSGEPLDVFGARSIPGSPARARVRLYDPGGILALEKDDLGDEGQASYFDAPAGTWLLEATDVAGAGGDDLWYVVYVRTYDPGAYHPFFTDTSYESELEPNDFLADASLMTVHALSLGTGLPYAGQFVDGTFDGPGDEDWFLVDAGVDDKITVRCFTTAFGSLTTIEAALFDGAADITPAGQGTTPTPLSHYLHNVTLPGPGEYGVRLRSGNGAYGPGAYYRCRLLQAPFDFATE